MTPAQHFHEAQECLDTASGAVLGSDTERFHLAAAAVHAQLAQVGAIILTSSIAYHHGAKEQLLDAVTG